MLLGIISDTHDEKEKILKAIQIFRDESVSKIIHLGDFVSPEIIYLFEGWDISAVLGNNDRDEEGILKVFEEIGGRLEKEILEFNVDGIKVCAYHGTKPAMRRRLIDSKKYNLFLYGHTHKAEKKKIKKTLCVNPGALKRVIKPSIALYDTLTKEANHIWF